MDPEHNMLKIGFHTKAHKNISVDRTGSIIWTTSTSMLNEEMDSLADMGNGNLSFEYYHEITGCRDPNKSHCLSELPTLYSLLEGGRFGLMVTQFANNYLSGCRAGNDGGDFRRLTE